MSNKCCHRVCGQHFCVRAEAWARVGCVVLIAPAGKQSGSITWDPKHLVKPGGSAETSPGTPFFTAMSSQAGRSGLLVLLFWFLSSAGTVAISDSHMLALGWLWLFFILNFSFFFFFLLLQWISSCFFQIQSVDEIAVLLSQSFLDLFKVRSQLLKSKQRGTFERVCGAPGLIAPVQVKSPNKYKAWLVSNQTGMEGTCRGWKRNVSCYNRSCHSAGNGE